MLKNILDWFKQSEQNHESKPLGTSAQRAAAALLVEVSLADHELTEQEQASLPKLLTQHTSLTTQECIELIEAASQEVDRAVSLHQFTQHINEHFSIEQKLDLLEKLWLVALSDNHLDAHEEHMIRRIADLLHLRHSEFMQSKHKAKQQHG